MKIDISHIAKLANLPLAPNEKKVLASQLEKTLEHIGHLSEIDTSRVEGTNEVTDLKNIWREDEIQSSLTQKQALSNAKQTHKGFFVVPVILAEAIE